MLEFDSEEEDSQEPAVEESQNLAPEKTRIIAKTKSTKRKNSTSKRQAREPFEDVSTSTSNSKSLKEHRDSQKTSKMVTTRGTGSGKVVNKRNNLEVSHCFILSMCVLCFLLSKSDHLVPYLTGRGP